MEKVINLVDKKIIIEELEDDITDSFDYELSEEELNDEARNELQALREFNM